MSAPSCYAEAGRRFKRWLGKYLRDRSAHAKARRSHADPTSLDADFAQVVRRMGGLSYCYDSPADLKAATAMLVDGARATIEHFPNIESSRNLGDIVDAPEVHCGRGTNMAMAPELVAFLEALTSSGSVAVLTNQQYSGNGGTPLPFFVMNTVAAGNPWSYSWDAKMQSPHDLALRRVCFRLLARMAFLSAERTLGRGPTHPSVDLPWHNRYDFIHGHVLVHRRNQAAALQVVYLMIFFCQLHPWRSVRQCHTDHTSLPQRFHMRDVLAVPGVLQALAADNNLWHLLALDAGFDARADSSRSVLLAFNVNFSSSDKEGKVIAMLRDSRLVSTWVSGEAGRFVLLEFCRQRRRRVIQVGRMVPHPPTIPCLVRLACGRCSCILRYFVCAYVCMYV